jgi:hypothetical protein
MLNYVEKSGIEQKINKQANDITEILEPERFVAKHFGGGEA